MKVQELRGAGIGRQSLRCTARAVRCLDGTGRAEWVWQFVLTGIYESGTGLRPSEIIERVVRDVDVFTKSLFIERAKTEAGDRKVEIPEVLWPHFQARIKGKKPLEPLLPNDNGSFYGRAFVLGNTRRICKALGLHRMTAHGLRGSHSTIAQEGGATGHLVAQQLGHANEKVTQDHYTIPGTKERQVRGKALRVLTKRGRS